jgi:hypothetical protein
MRALSVSSDRFRHFCEEILRRDFEANPKPEREREILTFRIKYFPSTSKSFFENLTRNFDSKESKEE